MRKLFCYGKKDFCEQKICTGECEYYDGSGSEYKKIETYFDLIRSMTDEEMCDAIFRLIYALDPATWFCKGKEECGKLMDADKEIPDEMCKACLLAKLRQPVDDTKPATMTEEKQDSGLLEES